jgi:hypothetical protein
MPVIDPASWTDRLRHVLGNYAEELLRRVAGKLIKPRSRWPVEELIERCLGVLDNPAVLDRRVQELEPGSRKILALIRHSEQPRWRVGNLVELATTLGETGLATVTALLEAGLLFPDRGEAGGARQIPKLKSFDTWLEQGRPESLWAFTHPAVCRRVLDVDLGLPSCPGAVTLEATAATQEADGLEWPLRLATLWQQVRASSLRRTQQGDFFKRDLDRLRADPVLNAAPSDNLVDIPDPAMLAVALAIGEELITDREGELTAGPLPEPWKDGLPAALASLWAALPQLASWNAEQGWHPEGNGGNPFPSAYLLCMLLLAHLPENSWAQPEAVAGWVAENHPFWKPAASKPRTDKILAPVRDGLVRFLLGLAYQWRMLQAAHGPEGTWVVRLSPTGRWLLGTADTPPPSPAYAQTFLVQPNLEILAYRQGLKPEMIFRLGSIAAWKTLGAACTLQLGPEHVYRALEAGETFESILQLLESHGMKATPAPVVEALKTWSNKRERIRVFPAAALFEFASADDLQEALARGLPGVRLNDRLAVVADESSIDYRHFRLAGTRDYCLPPERCVAIEEDGVTLTVDPARSDLLLDPELRRFAEPLSAPNQNGKPQYQLTPASLKSCLERGLSVKDLENWFFQRSGQELPAAARLLLTASESPPLSLRRRLILTTADAGMADGLQQWPGTRSFIIERLGPTTVVVEEDGLEAMRERLAALGIKIDVQDT